MNLMWVRQGTRGRTCCFALIVLYLLFCTCCFVLVVCQSCWIGSLLTLGALFIGSLLLTLGALLIGSLLLTLGALFIGSSLLTLGALLIGSP